MHDNFLKNLAKEVKIGQWPVIFMLSRDGSRILDMGGGAAHSCWRGGGESGGPPPGNVVKFKTIRLYYHLL